MGQRHGRPRRQAPLNKAATSSDGRHDRMPRLGRMTSGIIRRSRETLDYVTPAAAEQRISRLGVAPICPCHPEVFRGVRPDFSEDLEMTGSNPGHTITT